MNQWWYADNGVQRGPFGTDTLRRFVLDGLINGATLFWREGMAGWMAMEAIPELAALLPSLSGSAGNAPIQPQAHTPQPDQQMPAAQAAGVARQPGATMYGAAPKRGMGTGMKIFLGLVGCAIVLGIVVAALAFSNAEFRKGFVSGLEAHHQERVQQARELQGEAPAEQGAGTHAWPADMPPPNVPSDRPAAERPQAAGGGAEAETASDGNHTWTNPVTGRAMTVEPAWLGASEKTSQGMVFAYLFNTDNNNVALRVTGEKMPGDYSLQDVAANFRGLRAGQYQFSGQDQISLINGVRVWEADATNPNYPGATIHAQIAIIGGYCYSLVSSRAETNADGENKLQKLRAQFWDTVQ